MSKLSDRRSPIERRSRAAADRRAPAGLGRRSLVKAWQRDSIDAICEDLYCNWEALVIKYPPLSPADCFMLGVKSACRLIFCPGALHTGRELRPGHTGIEPGDTA